MITRLSNVNVFVHDQDEAIAFYTEKLGFELQTDVTVAEMGNFRWVSVGPVGQPDVGLALMAIPGPPVFDEDTAAKVRELMGKGALGGLFFATDDCRATYEELRARGVEFTEEPSERPYGVDAGFRDPSGNAARLVQPTEG